jgi:hypothetical protein
MCREAILDEHIREDAALETFVTWVKDHFSA